MPVHALKKTTKSSRSEKNVNALEKTLAFYKKNDCALKKHDCAF